MKLSAIARGVRHERLTTIQVRGTALPILLRPLSAIEEIDIAAAAIKEAKARGAEPKPGSSIYDAVYMASSIALQCLDPDSPVDAREPTCTSAEQVLTEFDTDTIALLYEQAEIWQEECSPSARKIGPGKLLELAKKVGQEVAEGTDPFEVTKKHLLGLSPRTRFSFELSMASLLWTSHVFRPPTSSVDSRAGTSTDATPIDERPSESPSKPSETESSESP